MNESIEIFKDMLIKFEETKEDVVNQYWFE